MRPGRFALLVSVAARTAALALADGPPEPVGDYGGRWVGDREIRVLDASAPSLHRLDRVTLASREQRLLGADAAVDPYGLAVPGDGTSWVLGDRGRFLFRFSESDGRLVDKRRLSEPCQGIATFGAEPLFVAVRLKPREKLLLRFAGHGLRPFSTIVSKGESSADGEPPPDLQAHLIRNLLRCGSGDAAAVPCWFVAGDPEVFLLSPAGSSRRVIAPAFTRRRNAPPALDDVGTAFQYPVRDVFLMEGGGLWVLSNQEGERTPIEPGASRGRHAAFVRGGRTVRVVAFAREARAILDVRPRSLVLLSSDGFVETVPLP